MALLASLLPGTRLVGVATRIVLVPVGAVAPTWKFTLAKRPPVVLVTLAAVLELTALMNTSPGVPVAVTLKLHVPLGGGLVRSDPGVTSASATLKTVGS